MSLKITTSVLEKIDILVERAKDKGAIQVNTNEEQIKEEVVAIGVQQPEKEIERGKTICTEMVGKEIDLMN
jgi:hypothetical protein